MMVSLVRREMLTRRLTCGRMYPQVVHRGYSGRYPGQLAQQGEELANVRISYVSLSCKTWVLTRSIIDLHVNVRYDFVKVL